jgi:hypothetical protein
MEAQLRRFLFIGALLFWGVTTATASVGSIINSFQVPAIYPPEMTCGVYRDDNYVYVVFYDISDYFYLKRYAPDGTPAGYVWLYPEPYTGPPIGADHAIQGPGYITFPWSSYFALTFSLATGQIVGSFNFSPPSDYYAYIPGSQYLYTRYQGIAYRRTTSGSVLGSFPVTGILGAATGEFNGSNGEYIITEYGSTDNYAYVYTGDGSFVSSFSALYSRDDPTCGPGYPAWYGTTYWRFVKDGAYYGTCYQIDLGATTNVVPASLGKIKAIYR